MYILKFRINLSNIVLQIQTMTNLLAAATAAAAGATAAGFRR